METPKIVPNISSNDSETVDDMSMENNKKKNTGRRLQDGILSKDPGRKLNLDRRDKNSERRADSDPKYKGPARRLNLDRRQNLKDRRDKE